MSGEAAVFADAVRVGSRAISALDTGGVACVDELEDVVMHRSTDERLLVSLTNNVKSAQRHAADRMHSAAIHLLRRVRVADASRWA